MLFYSQTDKETLDDVAVIMAVLTVCKIILNSHFGFEAWLILSYASPTLSEIIVHVPQFSKLDPREMSNLTGL